MENETIVAGKKLRRFVDGAWERISFWHKAKDCEMENGNNLETEIQNIKDLINDVSDDNTNLSNYVNEHVLLYNPTTDYYKGYFNGQWKDVVYAGLKFDGYLIKDGTQVNIPIWGGFSPTSFIPSYYKDFKKANPPRPPLIRTYDNFVLGGKTIALEPWGASGTVFSLFPIDITRYNSLKYKISFTGNSSKAGSAKILLVKTKCDNFGARNDTLYYGDTIILSQYSDSNKGVFETTHDISKYSGYYYLAVAFGKEDNTYDYMNFSYMKFE